MDKKLSEFYYKALSRRNFLVGAGAIGAASALAGCSDSSPATSTPVSTAYTDTDILNFALNLEYLEAEFYLRAATGSGLATADIGTSPGTVTGGSQLTGLTSAQQQILNEIAYDEQEHVRFLRSALSTAAVARPAIDLTFFATLGMVATITTTATFNPFTNGFDGFLLGAFVFEDVGVTAYSGAAPLISTAGITAGYLGAAAGILAVEAYHAAYIRTVVTAAALSATPFTYATIANVNKVAALRSTLGGANETNLTLPVGTPTAVTTASTIVPATTANAIAFARTTDQVMHIVYGSATVGVKSGGFFPSGLNGNIKVTLT